MKQTQVGTFICSIGTNSKDNWKMIDLYKHTNYTFFHLTSFPSCYLVLETEEEPDLHTLRSCARLCLDNTKFKNLRGIYVDYTRMTNVSKGRLTGEVKYTSLRKVKKIKI
jgi:predicted ribosome quality control (RQC) complex YloA/Tae2 family protein